MSLMIDATGAQVFLDCLEKVCQGEEITETELAQVMEANRFFVDYYSQWPGVGRESLGEYVFDPAVIEQFRIIWKPNGG